NPRDADQTAQQPPRAPRRIQREAQVSAWEGELYLMESWRGEDRPPFVGLLACLLTHRHEPPTRCRSRALGVSHSCSNSPCNSDRLVGARFRGERPKLDICGP